MPHDIVKEYFAKKQVFDIKAFGKGHINDTYKVTVNCPKQSYILQKINTQVFSDPDAIAETHIRLQKVIFDQPGPLTIARILPNLEGNYITRDSDGNAWRMTVFFDNSYTIDHVTQGWQAYEAGNAYGWFALVCSQLDIKGFKESIKNFHSLSFRVRQLKSAIANNKFNRVDSVKDLIDFYFDREKSLSLIEQQVKDGKIPLRIVHNDTKINNLLFSGQDAIAVIDLDTVGPGIIYYDYGDAVRTSAITSEEDERDLSRVNFNTETFETFTKGYISQVNPLLTKTEKENFHLAPVLLTYLMGIRFLADYINGDTYYKIAYHEHNLNRSKVQRTFIESMENNEDYMKTVIQNCFSLAQVEK
jgi:hypothetical protein